MIRERMLLNPGMEDRNDRIRRQRRTIGGEELEGEFGGGHGGCKCRLSLTRKEARSRKPEAGRRKAGLPRILPASGFWLPTSFTLSNHIQRLPILRMRFMRGFDEQIGFLDQCVDRFARVARVGAFRMPGEKIVG